MDKASLAFIETMGIFGAENGTPRSIYRIIGYLLICEPAAQSAKEIQDTLKLSAGAVSNALNLLRKSGMIRPISISGTRSLLYEIDPRSWKRTLEQRLRIIPDTLQIIDSGLDLRPKNDRLLLMRKVYGIYEEETVSLLEKLDKIK
ncbi:MAG TPA: hypothetical protein VLG36_04520 [Candidatus Chromulinivoraceae bacterium]|nr:hypothetical protein [Candidatus Chromulinivoraceae bacterium]